MSPMDSRSSQVHMHKKRYSPPKIPVLAGRFPQNVLLKPGIAHMKKYVSKEIPVVSFYIQFPKNDLTRTP